jgi:ubiquinone/menaquinone biosynthesis C-methylase UbiE
VDVRERYGAASPFARIAKLEEPAFVLDLVEALGRAALAPDARVLDLGVGRGDDLTLLEAVVPGFAARGELVGIDHSASALEVARRRQAPSSRARFLEADLASLPALGLGTFDLVLSIATFQSPGIDDREVLRQIVQRHLAPRGAVIIGVPNCRYVDGEVQAGARVRNLRQAELGLLVKDLAFYRKYLQQHGRTVYVTGTDHVFVTAVSRDARAGAAAPAPR